ncbi:MAG: DNA recombination protein RmuC [Propionibacteriaceae bacterium]|nr:DNA recombination protein RmuC [Propionibacteriaceae bacterium]
MDTQLVVSIVIAVLLVIVVVLQLTSRAKSGIAVITTLLKDSATEQRESVERQLSAGATDQFNRFEIIQKSIQGTLKGNREELSSQLSEFRTQIDTQLSNIQRSGVESNEKLNATLESKVTSLQESNEKRLQQMQNVVDEKLQKTLETRLSQSFQLVSTQLDTVQQGLGEMKNLAADAKSLKNALTNIKERGTYGEVRLEKLLSDTLAPSQYETNVEICHNKWVEFAIKLPGSSDTPLLLPIDSKFPIEDFNRLLDAQDKADIDSARKALLTRIRGFAKEISEKYIQPPLTTDFAVMFLPTEGLYAEVVQNAAFFEELRDKYKVTAVGATTLSAFLSSLQMGFKTLAIEKRSLEVWDTLRAVKAEFGKFETMIDTVRKQIATADNTLEKIVGQRTRAINRKLRDVQELSEPSPQLQLEAAFDDEAD